MKFWAMKNVLDSCDKYSSQIYPIYSILSPEGYLCTKILSLNQGQQNAQK